MSDRQIGRTTRQMLDAPLGAVFVWCNSSLLYPKMLARRLQRDDIDVVRLSWLRFESVAGRTFTSVVVDHATKLDAEALAALDYLRVRGGTVNV